MINKKVLTERMRGQLKYKYKNAELEEILSVFSESVLDAVSSGEEVSISNFGKFYPRRIKGKTIKQNGISWLQGKVFVVPDRFLFGFKPSSYANEQTAKLNNKISGIKNG